MIALTVNFRSRLTGIATGDQAMFVTRKAFRAVGGFPDIALMEDIAVSRALKRLRVRSAWRTRRRPRAGAGRRTAFCARSC